MSITNINQVNFGKIHRVYNRQILDFMGQNLKDQPTKAEDLRIALKSMASADPETFIKYYNMCVYKKMPEGGSQLDADRIKMMSILSDHVGHLENEFGRELKERMTGLARKESERFADQAKDIIEKAKGQFVTYQVKVGNKKARKLSGIPPKQFKKLLSLAKNRINILMVGPSGCGKTHVAGMIAESFGLRYAAQSCSVGVSESSFTGWLLPTGDKGQFNHIVSAFLDMYENGGVFLIDEMDNADPNLLVFLNMALANDKFFLPQRWKNPEVKRHPDFVAVAAANTFGGGADVLYSSRNALDAATLDRFRMGTVAMDYDENVESALITDHTLLDWGKLIRNEISTHSMAKLMSTRALIDAQTLMQDEDSPWTLLECEEAYFADWAREEKAMVEPALRHFHLHRGAA